MTQMREKESPHPTRVFGGEPPRQILPERRKSPVAEQVYEHPQGPHINHAVVALASAQDPRSVQGREPTTTPCAFSQVRPDCPEALRALSVHVRIGDEQFGFIKVSGLGKGRSNKEPESRSLDTESLSTSCIQLGVFLVDPR